MIASPTFSSLSVSPTRHLSSYGISLCSCFPFHCLLHCSITLLFCPALVHTHKTHMKVLRVLLKIQAPNVNSQDPTFTHLQNPRKSNTGTRLLSPRQRQRQSPQSPQSTSSSKSGQRSKIHKQIQGQNRWSIVAQSGAEKTKSTRAQHAHGKRIGSCFQ